MEFVESNMKFSLQDDRSFMIEKSEIMRDYSSIKVCEVFSLIDDKLVLIEAKSSSPQPGNKDEFDKYIAEIGQKFIDTLLMYNAIILKRHAREYSNELPRYILEQDISRIRYAMCLIVHGNETEWMPPIQDALRNYLRHVLNAWNIPDRNVYALNHDDAQAKGLIIQYLPLDVLNQFKESGFKGRVLIQQVKQWFSENNV